MRDDERDRTGDRWARFRFAIVGPLLAAPPRRGKLRVELERLADRSWRHPITGEPVRFSISTLERWYYAARGARRDRTKRPDSTGALVTVRASPTSLSPSWA